MRGCIGGAPAPLEPRLTAAATRREIAAMSLKDRLPLLADLLMDAAHADDHLEGEETMAVKRLLREILDTPTLPMDLDFRIDEFDPKRFDRPATLAAFAHDSRDLKKRLHRADRGGPCLGRRNRLRRGRAAARRRPGPGAAPEDFQELVVDIVEEVDLGEDLERLRYGEPG